MEKRKEVSAQIHAEYDWDSIVRDQWAPLFARLAQDAPPIETRYVVSGMAAPEPLRFESPPPEERTNGDGHTIRFADRNASQVTERSVEIPWLLSRLGKPEKILDIGSADATYIEALVATGAAVTLCDTRPFTMKGDTSVALWIGSVTDMPDEFTDRFDLVTCISVLDHIGLDAYGNLPDDTALERTAVKLHQILAPGGRLLLTVPFGRNHVTTHPGGGQRVFGLDALRDLFQTEQWEWRGLDCWLMGKDGQYHPANVTLAEDAEYGGWRANACVALELVRKETVMETVVTTSYRAQLAQVRQDLAEATPEDVL
jgi:SAM-dependent methyltransferase